jgi:hypothetical protein
MHEPIVLTCLVAARIEPRPWLRPLPPPPRRRRRRARAALGSLLVAIGGILRREPEPDVGRRGPNLLDPAAPREL